MPTYTRRPRDGRTVRSASSASRGAASSPASRPTRRPTRLLGIGGAMALLGALTACGGGGGGEEAEEAQCAEDYVPSGELQVWVHEAETTDELLKTMYDEYKAEYPDVTVEMREIPYADFETSSLRSTSAGDGPDLIKLPGWSLPAWADQGLLYALDPSMVGYADQDELEAAYEEGTLDGVSFEDQVYALPVDYQNLMLFYNRTHFEEAGLDPEDPPSTWEEVADAADQLTQRSGNRITRSGFSWWYNVPIWVYLEMESLAAQLGGSVVDEEAEAGALSSAAGAAAVDYYVGLSEEDEVSSFDLVASTVLETFAQGDASMLVSGSFSGPSFAGLTEGAMSFEAGNLGVAPMPTFEDAESEVTAAYSWGWGVTDNADDPCLAGHLARWLSEPAQADRLFAEAGIATPYTGFTESDAVAASPANQVLVEQIPSSVYGARTPEFAQVMTELTQQVEAGATGSKSPEDVAQDFDDAMRRALR